MLRFHQEELLAKSFDMHGTISSCDSYHNQLLIRDIDGTDGHMSQRAISVELLEAMAVTSQLYKLSDVAARFRAVGMW